MFISHLNNLTNGNTTITIYKIEIAPNLLPNKVFYFIILFKFFNTPMICSRFISIFTIY